MEILDTTIVNVALPHIAGRLSTSFDEATWTLTSYLVANGIVLTISGWLGTVFGRKRYFLICLGMFTVCSFFCGIATSLVATCRLPALARVFRRRLAADPAIDHPRYVSAGTARRGIRRHRDRNDRRASARTDIGGILTDTYNLALGLFDQFAGWRYRGLFCLVLVEDPPWLKRRSGHIDFIGLSLITLGLGCLQIMLDRGEDG